MTFIPIASVFFAVGPRGASLSSFCCLAPRVAGSSLSSVPAGLLGTVLTHETPTTICSDTLTPTFPHGNHSPGLAAQPEPGD